MRLIFSLLTLSAIGYGGWYAWENVPQVQPFVHAQMKAHNIQTGTFQTLEIRYPAEELMRRHAAELLKTDEYRFLKPQLHYSPYLLMDVKYSTEQNQTKEGVLLWSLSDGEMVLNAETWEKSHGFEDCLLAQAEKKDFKVIAQLIESGGAVDRDALYQNFKNEWIESCRAKKLIVTSGSQFRLHFENPRLDMQPMTRFDATTIAHQPVRRGMKLKKRYAHSQIKQLTQEAFGKDFAVRRTQEIFLPVYSVAIENPDGSRRTVYFNALNGSRLRSL